MRLYRQPRPAIFLARPNRFIALCDVEGETVLCHVKNTGRCRELLIPGARVWLEASDSAARKTAFDLVAVENRGYLVNMDSQAPNKIFGEWLASGGCLAGVEAMRAEQTYRDSRFDFAYTRSTPEGLRQGFAEVKGVTLFDDGGMAYFPDAPTERGVRHVRELADACRAGYEAMLCFILQRTEAVALAPNDATHPAFGQALRDAAAAGVMLRAAVCHVTPDSCAVSHEVPVILNGRRAEP